MDPATYGNDHWLGTNLDMRLTHRRLIGEVEERQVEQWWATGTIDATGLEDVDEEEIDVVRAHVVRCPLGNPILWSILDGLAADLEAVGSVVLDPDTGELSEAVTEHAGIGSNLVILNSVICDKRFAGRQIGRWVAAEALETLDLGAKLEATIAVPLGSDLEGVAWTKASARLAKIWSSIGFVPVGNHVMVRNPDLATSYTGLERLREHFGVPTGL